MKVLLMAGRPSLRDSSLLLRPVVGSARYDGRAAGDTSFLCLAVTDPGSLTQTKHGVSPAMSGGGGACPRPEYLGGIMWICSRTSGRFSSPGVRHMRPLPLSFPHKSHEVMVDVDELHSHS